MVHQDTVGESCHQIVVVHQHQDRPLDPSLFLLEFVHPGLGKDPVVLDHLAPGLDSHPVAAVAVVVLVAVGHQCHAQYRLPEAQNSLLLLDVQFSSSSP